MSKMTSLNIKSVKNGLALFILAVTFVGCNKAAAPIAANQVDLNPTSSAEISKIYPHSEEFKKTRLHGAQFLSEKFVCAKCHGLNLSGGSTGVSCTQCHSSYPHPSEWSLPSNHGEHFGKLSFEDRQKCFSCHDSGLTDPGHKVESVNKVSCNSCHSIYPHKYDSENGPPFSGDDMPMYPHDAESPQPAKLGTGKCLNCHSGGSEGKFRNVPVYKSCAGMCHGDLLHYKWEPKPVPPAPPTPAPSGEPQGVKPPEKDAVRALDSKRKPAGKILPKHSLKK